MKRKLIFLGFLMMLMAVDAVAGTGDAYGAKPIFDKINGALNDTYIAAILTVGYLWKAKTIYKETQDSAKAIPTAAIGLGIGSIGAIATGISGAIF